MLEVERIRAGRWEAISRAHDRPELEVVHLDQVLDGLEICGESGAWQIAQPIPATLLSDGVQSFVVRKPGGEAITQFTIIAGEPLADDLRAEIELLRAELDLLKQAFRRHVTESAG